MFLVGMMDSIIIYYYMSSITGIFNNCMYCNHLSDLPDFGCNDFVARCRHGSLSRNIPEELEAALLFQ